MASVRDIIFIIIIFFVLALGMFIIHFTVSNMFGALQHSPINETAEAVTVLDSGQNLINRLDMLLAIVFIGLCLSVMITGWLVGGHPIFMFIYFMVIVIGVILSMVLSYVWESITLMTPFISTLGSFLITNHLISYLPYYSAVIGSIGMIVMFGKPND